MITVGIAFCDKDWFLVPALLKMAEKHMKVDYEIVTVDNRDDRSVDIGFEPTFSFGRNASAIQARKKICELASGDYIWYVDADDYIIGDVDFEPTADICTFKYNDIYGISEHADALWNAFIRRDIVAKVVRDIGDAECNFFEDVIVKHECLSLAATCESRDDVLYYHSAGICNSPKNDDGEMDIFLRGLDHYISYASRKPNSEEYVQNALHVIFNKMLPLNYSRVPDYGRVLPHFAGYPELVHKAFHEILCGSGFRSNGHFDEAASVFEAHFPGQDFRNVSIACHCVRADGTEYDEIQRSPYDWDASDVA